MALVAWYKMEENAANKTVADSAGAFTGTAGINTSSLTTPGLIGNGFNFQGSTNYFFSLAAAPINGLSTEFSMCFWCKMNLVDSTVTRIVDWNAGTSNGGFFIMVVANQYSVASGSHQVYLMVFDSTDAAVYISAGVGVPYVQYDFYSNWIWVCCTCKQADVGYLYYNNVLVGTIAFPNNFHSNNALNIRIGKRRDLDQYHFNGKLDDFRAYSHVLSAAERSFIYNHGRGTQASAFATTYNPMVGNVGSIS